MIQINEARVSNIGLFNKCLAIAVPAFGYLSVVIEVQLSIHKRIGFGIPLRKLSLGNCPSTVAPVLRRMSERIGFEFRQVGRAGETPLSSAPLSGKLLVALYGFAISGEVGEGVVTTYGKVAESAGVNGVIGGKTDGQAEGQHYGDGKGFYIHRPLRLRHQREERVEAYSNNLEKTPT